MLSPRVGEWAHLHELGLADALQLLRAVRLVHGVALREHGLDDVVAAVVDVVGDVLREVDLLLEAVALRQPQVPQVVVLRQKQSASQRSGAWGGVGHAQGATHRVDDGDVGLQGLLWGLLAEPGLDGAVLRVRHRVRAAQGGCVYFTAWMGQKALDRENFGELYGLVSLGNRRGRSGPVHSVQQMSLLCIP